jgi:hypothetical protein
MHAIVEFLWPWWCWHGTESFASRMIVYKLPRCSMVVGIINSPKGITKHDQS